MKKGDIILVPFPFSDLTSSKTRPALVVHTTTSDSDLIISAISSKKSKNCLPLNNKDLSKGELPLKSYIRYTKIVTINKNLVHKTVGQLNAQKLTEVLSNISALFK